MSNIQTGAERMPHDLSHLGFLAGQIGRLITISTTPVIAGDSFEMDAVGALRLSPLRRGLAIDSTVDIFTFYVPHRHVYGEQWLKFMKDGVNATPLPTVNTTGYIDHAAFLGTINPDTNKIPKHLFQGYLNIYNNYRLMNAMRQAHADGWFIVFDTLTLADDRLEAFYDNPNALRDYFRDIGRMVLAAEG